MLVDQYERDSNHKMCISFDLSPDGILLFRRPEAVPKALNLEFELPGQPDSVWARGDVRFCNNFGGFQGLGVAFTAMANGHWNMIQDWTLDQRLNRIRKSLRLH
jgi:hypothetical protein